MQEIEITFLDIDPYIIAQKLETLGAKKVSDEVFEEWIFQQSNWLPFHGRIRVRADQYKGRVAYKETARAEGEENTEIEFEVSDKDKAIAFFNKLDIPMIRHQQKRRVHFTYNDVVINIDIWPMIPPFVVIKGHTNDAVEETAKQLEFSLSDICELDARHIIRDIYKVDIDTMQEYVF